MTSGRDAECRQVVELLPWHVNGTLEAAERELVLGHLERCADCRAEAARCRAERELLRAEAEPAPAPHPAQLERLLGRALRGEADTEEPEATARGRRRLGRLLRRTPAPMRWLVAAQLAALAGLGILAARDRAVPPPAPFHALSAPAAATPAGAVLRVVFDPQATEAEVRALLQSARAEIVGGPSPVGAYTLRLDGSGAAEPLEVVVALLRAHPGVRLAEPLVGADAAPR